MGLFLLVMYMSGSRSAWLIEAALLLLWAGLMLAKRLESRARVLAALAAFWLVAATTVTAYFSLPALLEWMGRDATLSGRTLIWKQTWIFILQRPLLGWVYDAFLRGIQGESFRVVAAVHFIVFHAHNGFLEIWLELGAAGLAFFGLSYFRAWRRLWAHLRSGEVDRVMWMVFVLALILLYDLDENSLLIYNGMFWTLYVAALANVEFLAIEDRLRARVNAERAGKRSAREACTAVSQ
jgi:O-antigen ligase